MPDIPADYVKALAAREAVEHLGDLARELAAAQNGTVTGEGETPSRAHL